MLEFLASRPGCTVAIEACGGVHHRGHAIGRGGQEDIGIDTMRENLLRAVVRDVRIEYDENA